VSREAQLPTLAQHLADHQSCPPIKRQACGLGRILGGRQIKRALAAVGIERLKEFRAEFGQRVKLHGDLSRLESLMWVTLAQLEDREDSPQ